MQKNTTTRNGFIVRHRIWILVLAIVLFLPPLSFLFQFTQESNFCGTWCPRMFIVWREGMTTQQFLMGFMRAYMGVALVVGMLASTFFFGRYWCSHLCPIGGSMEAGARLVPRRLQINYSGIPASFFRYGYLSVFFIAPAIGFGSLCCNYCNFAAVPRLFGAAFSEADMAYFLRNAGLVNLGMIVVLGFMARGGRAYCNLLCPIGALDALANRFGLNVGSRVRVHSAQCNGCGICEKVCPTWAIRIEQKATIDQLSCVPCRICEESCPTGAIRYEKRQG